MRSSSVMISLLPPILLFAQIIIPASAHESENCYSGESGNNNACSRSSGDVVNDIVDDITAKSSTSQAMRDQRIRNLPPEYIEQLKEVDDYLTMEEENIDPIITCEEYLKMHDFVDPVDVSKSLYQEVSWAENPAKSDKCLTLDDTLQICNSYRPHYHEFFVHFSASFLPQMRRAIFVGGGDSMLLHELLHYPEIELIVGLELDQVVVRDSFRHFFTQPHFDNPKVQWWFGDAAKSLRMIPSKWYGTFDLVMVDLSETVISMSISEELDVLKALSMLVNPSHGVFVKNERYIREINKIFDHVIQIYLPNTPLLCDQDWVLGSHGMDFLQPDFNRLLKKYNIPTHLYRPDKDMTMHYEMIRKYSKNDPKKLAICKNESTMKNESPNTGLMMTLEAENSSYISFLEFRLSDDIEETIKEIGYIHVITSKSFIQEGGELGLILLREGYVTVRAWPNHDYCAVNIALWASFGQLEPIRDAILHTVGSFQPRDWSSFVMVVGGMLGIDRNNDLHETGPQRIPYEKCEDKVESNPATSTIVAETLLNSMPIAINESLSLLANTAKVAVVFCGIHGIHQCDALELMELHKGISHLLVLWKCPDEVLVNSHIDPTNRINDVVLCKATPREVMQDAFMIFGKIDLIVIDVSTPSASVLDAANSLCNVPVNSEKSLLAENSLFIIPYLDRIGDYFLEICRLQLDDRLLRVAEMSIEINALVGETIGYISLGNPLFLAQLAKVMKNIEVGTNVLTHLKYMNSIPVKQQYPYSPRHYNTFDFDEYPGMMQYARQNPLGKQSILQMQFANTEITGNILEERMMEFFHFLNINLANAGIENVGAGAIVYGVYSTGYAIFVWDGGSTIDLNIFSLNESAPHEEAFVEFFMNEIVPLSNLTLSEHFPRGVMKTINFSEDITASPGCVDRYLLCATFATSGDCDDEVDEDWMKVNCPKSCEMCPQEI